MLEAINLKKTFYKRIDGKSVAIVPLNGISLKIENGERVALTGKSGEGKSTFARILTGLSVPDGGDVLLNGEKLWAGNKYNRKRGVKIQAVFQQPYFSLNPRMSVGRAVKEAVIFHGADRKNACERVKELFEKVRLPIDLYDRLPSSLSGGQAQKAAIARALAANPEVLVSDEACSMLDAISKAEIIKIFGELANLGVSILYITHDNGLAISFADRAFVLEKGSLALKSGG